MWNSANSESVTGPDGTWLEAQVKRDERGAGAGAGVVRLAAGTARHGRSATASHSPSQRNLRECRGIRVVMVSLSGQMVAKKCSRAATFQRVTTSFAVVHSPRCDSRAKYTPRARIMDAGRRTMCSPAV